VNTKHWLTALLLGTALGAVAVLGIQHSMVRPVELQGVVQVESASGIPNGTYVQHRIFLTADTTNLSQFIGKPVLLSGTMEVHTSEQGTPYPVLDVKRLEPRP
jgi:hypothetical protein